VKPSVDGRPGLVLKLSDNVVQRLVHAPAFYVEISGVTPAVEFGAGEMPVVLFVPAGNQGAGAMIQPKFSDGRPVVPRFLARSVRKGMLLMGDANGAGTVAVYRFRGAHVDHGAGGNAAFQLKPWFERNGDFQGADTGFSVVSLEILNRKNNRSSGVLRLTPEMDRTTYIDLPADELAGGDFDVILQDLTPNQWLGIEPTSLALVTADRSFAFNLFKSLFVLWMLSVLVVVISVFCSTFLSWPIAIVLTLVILLGRWGVDQLGDALNPGVGRLVAGDFRVNDPGTSRVVSTSVEGLAKALKDLAAVLPDVSRFPVSEDIERGISVPAAKITGAMEVLLIYGLILVSMSYLILKRKEVAP
jgi:hypothetical protein